MMDKSTCERRCFLSTRSIPGLMYSVADLVIHSNLREYDEYTLVELPIVKEDHVIVSQISLVNKQDIAS
jgi:hypothetical protein